MIKVSELIKLLEAQDQDDIVAVRSSLNSDQLSEVELDVRSGIIILTDGDDLPIPENDARLM